MSRGAGVRLNFYWAGLKFVMSMRLVALIVIVSLLSASSLRADTVVPVVVSIVGRGRIRVRIAEGIRDDETSAPCSSTRNRMLFDGWMDAGTTSTTIAHRECVCIQHTYGAFRNVNWSSSSNACRQLQPTEGKLAPDIRLVLSTEQP